MTTPPPFEKTSAEERKAILKALAHRLQISARLAERDSDPICRSLLALSVRLAGARRIWINPVGLEELSF